MNNKLKIVSANPDPLIDQFKIIEQKIKNRGDLPHATVAKLLSLLSELKEFPLGRYLIEQQRLNGYWIHYMLMHDKKRKPQSELEAFMLERAPAMLATRERFKIFLKENQSQVKDGAALASIPCGLMDELTCLNYDSVTSVHLLGIDIDSETIIDAYSEANKKANKSAYQLSLHCKDAWEIDYENEFDLISSNGLTIYEPDNDKVIQLFKLFYRALKPGGKLVTSFLTPPPGISDDCEIDMNKVNQEDLLLQRILMIDILEAKWNCYRSSKFMQQIFEDTGFKNIKIIYDQAKIYPTIIGFK